jgi:hypothetical protein
MSKLNIAQLQQDIVAAGTPPEKFVAASMYTPRVKCFCVFGWLAHVIGGFDPSMLNSDPVYMWVTRRYGPDVWQLGDSTINLYGKWSPEAGHSAAPATAVLKHLSEIQS